METLEDAAERSDPSKVFVVHGRNLHARDAMFAYLRTLNLSPLEWSQAVKLTNHGSPYIGDVLDRAFETARAIVVLLTPDEITYLRQDLASGEDDPDTHPSAQARPNVLFEAGLAFGRNPRRTILVEFGRVRPFSDIMGRHSVRLNDSTETRKDLADRLITAGCKVDLSGTDWMKKGLLEPPAPPGGGLQLGKRVMPSPSSSVRLDARYRNGIRGEGRLEIQNLGAVDVYDVSFKVPEEAGPSFHVLADLPLKKLPAGKSKSYPVSRAIGRGSDSFEITITGRTAENDKIETLSFIDLIS
ncbi:hypothetical protein BH23CHL5_BH23CHL5_23940 [soil metagenome]